MLIINVRNNKKGAGSRRNITRLGATFIRIRNLSRSRIRTMAWNILYTTYEFNYSPLFKSNFCDSYNVQPLFEPFIYPSVLLLQSLFQENSIFDVGSRFISTCPYYFNHIFSMNGCIFPLASSLVVIIFLFRFRRISRLLFWVMHCGRDH